jgi:membrane protease YdiL (CAAX protease family)
VSDEQPFERLGAPPAIDGESPRPPEPPESALPVPEREPFWGFSDVGMFVGFLVAGALAAVGLLNLARAFFHWRTQIHVAEDLLAQSLVYVLAYGALALQFRLHYQRPFWHSLGWRSFGLSPVLVAICGVLTAVSVAFVGVLIRTPATNNRITEMLSDPRSLVLVAIFGLTLAPLAEELGFRGFLQPLLVRTLGPVPGVLGAAILFGLLHFQEYGNSWKHALLISLAGAAFGWMRHRTGSTRASALMHASYNALEFVAYFANQKEIHHS